jgi:glycerophosphoryl diester phosphodiesterase
MESFSGAVAMGFRHIETDIHITSDRHIVCIHDSTIDRTTDGLGQVSAYRLDELQSFDAGFRHAAGEGFRFRGAGLSVPTLEEVLTTFPDVSIVVDMKTDGIAEPLAELVDRLAAHDRLIVGAFDDERVETFRNASRGRVPTSTGPALARMWVLASRVGRGGGGEASALQLPTQIRGVRVVDEKLVRAAHESEIQVHVWTVNDPDEMESLLDMGVDGLVTDRPDILRGLLEARDQWLAS